MDLEKGLLLRRYKWHIVIVCAALLVVFLLTVFTDIFEAFGAGSISQLIWFLGTLVLLVVVVSIFSKTFKIFNTLTESSERLEQIAEALKKNRSVLTQINQNTRLSETAKTIAFRDADRQSLREAVFDKLQQQDFDTSYEGVGRAVTR
jgi:ABC-type multidrug transport system fused ATPase/permease subunit